LFSLATDSRWRCGLLEKPDVVSVQLQSILMLVMPVVVAGHGEMPPAGV
jgi:hypothetical protein